MRVHTKQMLNQFPSQTKLPQTKLLSWTYSRKRLPEERLSMTSKKKRRKDFERSSIRTLVAVGRK